MEKAKVTIYTDGACSGNPGPGGYAAIIMAGDSKKEIFGACANTTNNRMELMAAIEGLKVLKKPCEVSLYSDSAYLVNAYNSNWVSGWKRNGWKNSSKEPVKNIDLWQALEDLRAIHDVTFIKVKGHADNEFNNRCDELAVQAIKKLQSGELKEENTNKSTIFFTDEVSFETERLNIRLFKEDDVEDIFECYSNELCLKYTNLNIYEHITHAKDRLDYWLSCYNKQTTNISWAIEYKENGKVIGNIEFIHWSKEDNSAEVVYLLNHNYWNLGLMTEALKSVIDFGFNKMGLNRIEIKCDERNIASDRVINKNGLKYEGTLRQSVYSKGEYINLKVYSILKEEYENKR